MHAVLSRALVLLALLLVALPLGATGGSQYFCRTMGRLMDDCCCRAARVAQSALSPECGTEIRSKDCCDRLDRAVDDAVAAVREGVPRIDSPAVATLGSSVAVVAEPAIRMLGAEPVKARAPPRPGAPIFLKNCSLLT